VNLADVIGPDPGQNEVAVLAGELAHVQGQLASLEEQMLTNPDLATLAKVAARLEAQKKEVGERLAEARRKAPGTLGEQWGECQSLMELIDTAPDPVETRLRLRSLLSEVVEGIWMLVVARGRDRLAAVQIRFVQDGRRDYLVFSRPTHANGKGPPRPGCWRSWSLADKVRTGDRDLRQPGAVRALEDELLHLDLAALTATANDEGQGRRK
jgi:hypothetical protein